MRKVKKFVVSSGRINLTTALKYRSPLGYSMQVYYIPCEPDTAAYHKYQWNHKRRA